MSRIDFTINPVGNPIRASIEFESAPRFRLDRGGLVTIEAVPTVTAEPTVRLNSTGSAITQTNGRATSVSDLKGVANAVNTTGAGPLVLADSAGRKFLRFNESEYLSGGTGFVADTQNCTVVMVARFHRSEPFPVLSLGNVEAATGTATSNPLVRTITSGESPAFLCSSRSGIPNYSANREYMLPGCELQVIAVRSSASSVRTLINNRAANSTANSNSATGVQGYEVARNAENNAPGTPGSWGQFDLYDLLLFDSALTDVEVDAVVADLVSGYAIPTKTNRLIMEGDSITFGLRGTSGENPAMCLTDPGDPIAMPGSWNVLNMGVSGNKIADLVTRRDDANSVYAETLPGENAISLHIGTNNFDGGATQSATDGYNELVLLINQATTGYLQRGWEVFTDLIIAYDNATVQAKIASYRNLINSETFLDDTASNTGDAFAGKVTVVDVASFQVDGGPVFDTQANAQNINEAGLTIYDDDVHLTDTGNFHFADIKSQGVQGTAAPPPPPPPPSPGYLGSSITTGDSTSIVATVPPQAVAGCTLIAWGFTGTGNEFNTPAGWTERLTENGGSVRTLENWDGTTNNYTFTNPTSPQAITIIAVFEYVYDSIGAFSAATTDPVPPDITVGAADSIVFTLVGSVGAAKQFSMPAGWTEQLENGIDRSLAVYQRDALAPAGVLAGETVTRDAGSGNSRALQIAVRPAP